MLRCKKSDADEDEHSKPGDKIISYTHTSNKGFVTGTAGTSPMIANELDPKYYGHDGRHLEQPQHAVSSPAVGCKWK